VLIPPFPFEFSSPNFMLNWDDSMSCGLPGVSQHYGRTIHILSLSIDPDSLKILYFKRKNNMKILHLYIGRMRCSQSGRSMTG
jgi:hypothetical protein